MPTKRIAIVVGHRGAGVAAPALAVTTQSVEFQARYSKRRQAQGAGPAPRCARSCASPTRPPWRRCA